MNLDFLLQIPVHCRDSLHIHIRDLHTFHIKHLRSVWIG